MDKLNIWLGVDAAPLSDYFDIYINIYDSMNMVVCSWTMYYLLTQDVYSKIEKLFEYNTTINLITFTVITGGWSRRMIGRQTWMKTYPPPQGVKITSVTSQFQQILYIILVVEIVILDWDCCTEICEEACCQY
jgi:cytochrome bd-type quinol oxidase subunit 1